MGGLYRRPRPGIKGKMATIYRGNDTDIKTAVITDINGAPVTTGTVNASVWTPDGVTELIAAAAATHVSGGVWKRSLSAQQIDAIPAKWEVVLVRFTFGSPVDATFEERQSLRDRRG